MVIEEKSTSEFKIVHEETRLLFLTAQFCHHFERLLLLSLKAVPCVFSIILLNNSAGSQVVA